LNQKARSSSDRYFVWYGVAAIALLAAGGIYWFDATPSQPGAGLAMIAPGPETASFPKPEPAAAVAPDPAATPEPVRDPVVNKAPAKGEQKPLAHQPPRPLAATKPVPMPVPVPTQAPVTPPVSEARIAPPPVHPTPPPVAAAGLPGPQEACGKRVFLALAICMQEQCQTPQFIKHPQCVQMFQQQKDNRQRNAETF
jgi:hypothetical protein